MRDINSLSREWGECPDHQQAHPGKGIAMKWVECLLWLGSMKGKGLRNSATHTGVWSFVVAWMAIELKQKLNNKAKFL